MRNYEFLIIASEYDSQVGQFVYGVAYNFRQTVYWKKTLSLPTVEITKGIVNAYDFSDELNSFIYSELPKINEGFYEFNMNRVEEVKNKLVEVEMTREYFK